MKQFIVLKVSFKISRLSPTFKRKIKALFFFSSLCVHFLFRSFISFFFFFFPHFYFIYFGAYENFSWWMEISIYFQFLNCWSTFPPEPHSRVRTFSAPLYGSWCCRLILGVTDSFSSYGARIAKKLFYFVTNIFNSGLKNKSDSSLPYFQ